MRITILCGGWEPQVHPETPHAPEGMVAPLLERRHLEFIDAEFIAAEPRAEHRRLTAIFAPGSGLTAASGRPVSRLLSELGVDSYALNFRGRRGELPESDYGQRGISDFTADLHEARTALAEQGIPYEQQLLVGHSAGGLSVMDEAQREPAAGVVLLAPGMPAQMPLQPLSEHELSEAREKLLAAPGTIERNRESLRSWFGDQEPDDVDQEYDRKYQPMLGHESKRARDEAYYFPPSIDPSTIKVPVLVVGATHDNRVNPEQCRRLAQYLGGEYLELPASHLMMLEESWPTVREPLDQWLRDRVELKENHDH